MFLFLFRSISLLLSVVLLLGLIHFYPVALEPSETSPTRFDWSAIEEILVEAIPLLSRLPSIPEKDPELRPSQEEVASIRERLQRMDTHASQQKNANFWRMREIRCQNASDLKSVLDQWGWPSISAFGSEADHSAWRICQRSDYSFQQECLQHILNALPETNPKNLAYLIDRILLLHEGKPQIFGTQFNAPPGHDCLWFKSMEYSLDRVETMREAFGLPTLKKKAADIERIINRPLCDPSVQPAEHFKVEKQLRKNGMIPYGPQCHRSSQELRSLLQP